MSVANKVKIIDRKLTEASAKGQKPSVNAIAQGFQPSRQALAHQVTEKRLRVSLVKTIFFDRTMKTAVL
jgi:hypothetical protein